MYHSKCRAIARTFSLWDLSEEQSHYAIRIGCGRFNTDEDIEIATSEIVNSIESLSKIKI